MKTVDVDVLVEELQKAAAHKGLGAAIAGIILEFIETLPAIDVVERSSFEAVADKYVQIQDKLIRGELVPVIHGRWEKFTLDTYDFALRLRCSMCQKVVYEEEFKFCPYCGARMDDG